LSPSGPSLNRRDRRLHDRPSRPCCCASSSSLATGATRAVRCRPPACRRQSGAHPNSRSPPDRGRRDVRSVRRLGGPRRRLSPNGPYPRRPTTAAPPTVGCSESIRPASARTRRPCRSPAPRARPTPRRPAPVARARVGVRCRQAGPRWGRRPGRRPGRGHPIRRPRSQDPANLATQASSVGTSTWSDCGASRRPSCLDASVRRRHIGPHDRR
jgi:hypothetical protein